MKNIIARKFITIVLAAAVSSGSMAVAQEFKVTPGSLGVTVSVPADASTIVLDSRVNGADLHYIATHCRGLRMLDLSKVSVVSYSSNRRLTANVTAHVADELPPFQLSGLKAGQVRLPEGITAIGAGALMGAEITSVVIPASVKSIGDGAFAACRNLTEVTVPATVGSVGSDAFNGCTSLARVTYMADDVPSGCFAGCVSLREVSLPQSGGSIGARAFSGCVALEDMEMPDALRTIGEEAFAASGIVRADMSGCRSLASVGDRAFAKCLSLESVEFPSGATVSMGEGLFFDDSSLMSVRFPDVMSHIPDMTLKGATGLSDIYSSLPEGVETIGRLAYHGMGSVAEASLPSTLSYIGDRAFEGWTSLQMLDATQLREVPALGENVWAGVDQASVLLSVTPEMEDSYLAADQWKEFSIRRSGTTGIELNGTGARVSVMFDGMTLRIRGSEEILSAVLHDMSGYMLASETPQPAVCDLDMDTSGFSTQFFILTVRLVSGDTATLKLLRK